MVRRAIIETAPAEQKKQNNQEKDNPHRLSSVEAACAAIRDQSDYPDIAEWTDYFLHSRASDADALGAFAPRDGRAP